MKLVTVVYEVVNEEEMGKTNQLHYAHNGLLAKTMQISLEELSDMMQRRTSEAGVTVEQLARQYDEARELANATGGVGQLLGTAKQADERRYMLRHFGSHEYLRVEKIGRATGSRIVMDWADKSESFELAYVDALSIKKAYETITGVELVEVEEVDRD